MLNLARRNLEIYFKSKATVFFSLMGTLIIFLLYIMFLGNLWKDLYASSVNVSLVDKWAMAGILSVVSMTSSTGALSIMVADRTGAIRKDFYASPVSSSKIAGGYILAATLIGLIMSAVTLIFAEAFIFIRCKEIIGGAELLELLFAILLVSLCNSSIMIFFASFFKNHQAFTSSVGILNTLAGFIAGAYIPIGMFPRPLQVLMQITPIYNGSVVLRDILMNNSLSKLGLEVVELQNICASLGVRIRWGTYMQPMIVSYIVIIGVMVISLMLSGINLCRRDK